MAKAAIVESERIMFFFMVLSNSFSLDWVEFWSSSHFNRATYHCDFWIRIHRPSFPSLRGSMKLPRNRLVTVDFLRDVFKDAPRGSKSSETGLKDF